MGECSQDLIQNFNLRIKEINRLPLNIPNFQEHNRETVTQNKIHFHKRQFIFLIFYVQSQVSRVTIGLKLTSNQPTNQLFEIFTDNVIYMLTMTYIYNFHLFFESFNFDLRWNRINIFESQENSKIFRLIKVCYKIKTSKQLCAAIC